jgi:hypothetical protein
MKQFAVSWPKLQEALVQPERPLVFHVIFLKWFEPVPSVKDGGYHQPNPETDQEEPPVVRKSDQKDQDHCHRDYQASRASEKALGFTWLEIQFQCNPRSAILGCAAAPTHTRA